MTAKDLSSELLSTLQDYSSLGIKDQIKYDKFYLYSIITHSTAIEGSTVTEVEAQLLFDEGNTSSKRTITEQMMNLDLKKAYVQNDTLNVQNDTLNDTLNLTTKERTVLQIIQSNLTITTEQIVQKSTFSRPTVMRAIKSLKEKNLLERINSKKTGSWKVKH